MFVYSIEFPKLVAINGKEMVLRGRISKEVGAGACRTRVDDDRCTNLGAGQTEERGT